MSKLLYKYNDNDFNEKSKDKEHWYETICEQADKILTTERIALSGTIQRWNGKGNLSITIHNEPINEIIVKNIEVDKLEILVYDDKVEVYNAHHDGTNMYIFRTIKG